MFESDSLRTIPSIELGVTIHRTLTKKSRWLKINLDCNRQAIYFGFCLFFNQINSIKY